MSQNSPSCSLYLRDTAGNTKVVKLVPSPSVTSLGNGGVTANGVSSPSSIRSQVSSRGQSNANSPQHPTAGKTNQYRLSPSQMGAISSGGLKRSASSQPAMTPPPAQRGRKSDKTGKGLRHFSMRVCEKVQEKGVTTYNEVADELVAEETAGSTLENAVYDQKNIRRRVYDALNVLMAMNIISKEKKEIRWIGLPTNSIQECQDLEKENRERRRRIEAKQLQLKQLIMQQVAFTSLVNRNKETEERGMAPAPNSAIQLPFIIVNTNKKTHINCSISNDKSEYSFKFDDKFEIHDDVDVLKKMGLLQGLDKGECAPEDVERFKKMVPKSLGKYVETYGRSEGGALEDEEVKQELDDDTNSGLEEGYDEDLDF